jgi:hypothetical protein
MSNIIQTERLKRLLYLWPEKAIKMLYNDYYDNLTFVAQRLTRDIHAAEDIVQYTLAELWLRHREMRVDAAKSVQHYLVQVVKKRSREAFARRLAWYRMKGIATEIPPDDIDDEEDVRFITGNPPLPYDKFGFDQSTYYGWRQVEYIFYPWMKCRKAIVGNFKYVLAASVFLVLVICAYSILG